MRDHLRTGGLVILVAALVGSMTAPSDGEELIGLALGPASALEIDQTGTFAIPRGTSVVLRFLDRDATGAFPVVLDPGDVAIPPVRLGGDRGTFEITLDGPGKGAARVAADGRVSLELRVVVLVSHRGGKKRFPLVFTTEASSVREADGRERIRTRGSRLDPGSGEVTLVASGMSGEPLFDGPEQGVVVRLAGALTSIPDLGDALVLPGDES